MEDSAAPGTTTADVGKPEGGMVKEPVEKRKKPVDKFTDIFPDIKEEMFNGRKLKDK